MAATIHTLPSSRKMALDAIWLKLGTTLWAYDPAYFQIQITGTNSADQTITLAWLGNTLVFTLKASPDGSGLQLPRYSSGTIATYTDALAEALRQNQTLHADFAIAVTGGSNVLLTYRHGGAIDLSGSETISNLTLVVSDSAGNISAANLRAVVEVYEDTGDMGADARLCTLHSPHDDATGIATFDLRPAFAHLGPHLPTTTSIDSFEMGYATSAFQKYYFRYADKYGTPAVAEAMVRFNEGSFYAFHGGTAGESSGGWANEVIRHVNLRRDGEQFRKPIGEAQPDWGYFWNLQSGARKIRVDTWKQDGTAETSAITHELGTIASAQLIWCAIGPQQLGLDIWADPDNPIVRYSVGYYNSSTGASLGKIFFEVMPDCQDWGLYLLYDNGVSGCETIWLKGKMTEGYDASADTVQRPRTPDWTAELGEFDKLGATGQPTWECSTGYYDDDSYLTILRQFPLSSKAWLVDVQNDKFRKVIVEAKKIESVTQDDQDLFFMNITLRAAWVDMASNL